MESFEMTSNEEKMWRFQVAKQAALTAGNFVFSERNRQHSLEVKGLNDIVTEVDKASEKCIIDIIRAHFPEDGIFAEETGIKTSSSSGRWIIDPIDGTENFVRGIPFYAVSIAYEQTPGEPELGVVYSPSTGELFSAVQGGKAFLGKNPIKVSDTSKPKHAISLVSPPFRLHKYTDDYFSMYKKIFLKTCDVRNIGSAALHMCYIAAGRADGYFEYGVLPYDIAAGLVILTEAGGTYSSLSGQGHPFNTSSIIATNGHLQSWYEEQARKP